MNAKLQELAERRAELIAHAALQRAQLAECARVLSKPLIVAEQAASVVRIFTASPFVLAGISALLVKTPWRRLAKLPPWLWSAWKMFRTVRHLRA